MPAPVPNCMFSAAAAHRRTELLLLLLLAVALSLLSTASSEKAAATARGAAGEHCTAWEDAASFDDECQRPMGALSSAAEECALNALQFRGQQLATATKDDGVALPPLSVLASGAEDVTHVFAIGDWGALLPDHLPAPNTRPVNSAHKCPENCHYVVGVDDNAQVLVAEQMKRRAEVSKPQYILNAGDNFYWQGINQSCGEGTVEANNLTISQYAEVWQSVYGDLTSIPWISTLGNHDYGGWKFTMAWDQQIAYSRTNPNWVMPSRFFSQMMIHPGFVAEVFVFDNNALGAWDPDFDQAHNLCSAAHNPPNASCASSGGPSSLQTCRQWWHSSYELQKRWLLSKVASSKADWQIAVTHYPCGYDEDFQRRLGAAGLDLLITGHRHDQELWAHSSPPCIVTGGGGGITSEKTPLGMMTDAYGFFDLAITKSSMKVESVNVFGQVVDEATLYPNAGPSEVAHSTP